MSDGKVVIDTKLDSTGIEKGTRNVKSEVMKLAQVYKKQGMSMSEAMKKANKEIEKDSSSSSQKVKSNVDGIASVAKKCAGILGTLFVLDKVKDYTESVAKTGIAYNAMAEQSQVAWTTILGSSDAAVKMMKDIENYAAKTPFSKMGVDEMAKQLSNAGFKGQSLFDQLTKFGDMGSAFGIQEDSLKEMVRQYAQVQQAGVAYTEDLNIMQDRGIPIYKALAEVMGVPVSQVKKLASEGKVTAEVYNKAVDSMSNKTKGAMDGQSKTFNGMISTLKDNLTILAGALAKPLFEKMKQGLQDLMPKLENFIKLVGTEGIVGAVEQTFPQLKPLIELLTNIGDVLTTTVIPALLSFGSWCLDNIGPIGFLATTIGGIVLALKAMSIVTTIIAVIQALAAVFGILEVASLGEAAAQWKVNLAFLACPITWIVIAIGALVGGFIYLWTTSEGFRNFWIGLWNNISSFFSACWNGIINFLTVTIPAAFNSVINFIKNNWAQIGLFILNPIAGAFALLYNNCDGFKNFIDNFINNVKTFFVNGFNNIKNTVVQFAKDTIVTFQNWGSNVWNFFTTTIPNWIMSIGAWFAEIPGKIGSALGSVVGAIADWGISVYTYFATNIPLWISSIGAWFGELPYKIGYALGFAIGSIIQWGINVYTYLVTNVPIWINSIGAWFSALPGRIWTWLVNSLTKIGTWGAQIYIKATQAGQRFVNGVIDWVCKLPGRIGTWLSNVIGRIGAWASQMYFKAVETGQRFVNGVITWFAQLPGRIWSWLCNAVSKIGAWGSNLFHAGVEAAGQLVRSVIDTVKSIPGKMVDIGKNIVEGVWQGITGAASWFGDKVSGFFGGIVDGAKSALGIHSPARKMYPVGKYTVEGAEVGMAKQFPKLQRNMKDKITNLVSDMKAKVQLETSHVTSGISAKSGFAVTRDSANNVINTTNDNGVVQNITFNEPVESPVETARRIKQAGRDIVFG